MYRWTIAVLMIFMMSVSLSAQTDNTPEAGDGYTLSLVTDDLSGPVEIVVDSEGAIFVANSGEAERFAYEDSIVEITEQEDGEAIVTTRVTGLEGASGLAIDSADNLYVSQDLGISLHKYSRFMVLQRIFASHRTQGWADPNTLTLMDDERLLAPMAEVADPDAWRIVVYDTARGVLLEDYALPFDYEFVHALAYDTDNERVFIAGNEATESAPDISVIEAGGTAEPYAPAENVRPTIQYQGLALADDGTLYASTVYTVYRIQPDGTVDTVARNFTFGGGLHLEDNGCLLIGDWQDGITGSLYRACPTDREDTPEATDEP